MAMLGQDPITPFSLPIFTDGSLEVESALYPERLLVLRRPFGLAMSLDKERELGVEPSLLHFLVFCRRDAQMPSSISAPSPARGRVTVSPKKS